MKYLILAAALAVSSFALGDYHNDNYDDDYDDDQPTRCSLQVLIERDLWAETSDDAKEACQQYSDFCAVRGYGDESWESSIRFKRTFTSKNAREVISLFDRFLRRSRFIGDGFDISLNFTNCGPKD